MRNTEGWKFLFLRPSEERLGYYELEFVHTGNHVTGTLLAAAGIQAADAARPMPEARARELGNQLDRWLAANQQERGTRRR